MNQDKDNHNNLLIYKKIDAISKKIGFSDKNEKTIIEIEETDNPDVKNIKLTKGSWDTREPWFAIDENRKIHALLSMETLLKIMEALKMTQQENFNLKLEKTIWQNIPIDFQDVWVVAMDEIKKIAGTSQESQKSISIDIEKLVQNIKKEHPNLFLDLKNIHFEQ